MPANDGDPVCDVSVVLPFDDDEERVGTLIVRIAEHLRQLEVRFEILAVAEDSSDNSIAVLSLLRAGVPELRCLASDHAQGFTTGVRQARGSALWLLDAQRATSPFGPFSWAYARVHSGMDVVAVTGRYVVCRRTRVWRCLKSVRGRGAAYERRLLRRAFAHGLGVETHPNVPPRAIARLLGGLPGRLMELWGR